MYKCIHCNEIIPNDQFEGRIVKAGPKLYCVKCGEPVVEVPDIPSIGASFHGAQATLISNSDNRITTNNYYGSTVDDVIETPFGQYKRSETRLCKRCKRWVPLEFFNLERGVCDDCISKEANNSLEEGKVYMETGLYDDALSCFLQYEKICTDESDLSNVRSLIGRCYYEQEDYKNALKYFVRSSKTNSDSQYYLGEIYFEGKGVGRNYQEAFKWFSKAAEQGDIDSQVILGYMYKEGLGVVKNYQEAKKWYQKAAEQGDAIAQYSLGLLFYEGEGVNQSYQESVKWYLKAAEQGNADAQNALGDMYFWGYGVEKNYQEAVKWYHKAAEQGDTNAQTRLGQMYDNGYGVEKNYHEAVKWYRKAAELGNVDAQCFLGAKYYDGEGVEKNYQEAFKWFSKAAEQGDIDSQVILGYMYKEGLGVVKNYQEAKKWYQKAAEQGDEEVKEQLKEL